MDLYGTQNKSPSVWILLSVTFNLIAVHCGRTLMTTLRFLHLTNENNHAIFFKILFVKEKKAASQLKTYLIFNSNLSLNLEKWLIFFFKQTPLFPFNVYHLLVLNPSKEIAPAYLSRSSLCSFYQKNEKKKSIVHLKGSNRQK